MRTFGNILGIICIIVFFAICYVMLKETHIQRMPLQHSTGSVLSENILPDEIRDQYYSVMEIGYGYIQHPSGIRKMGITVIAYNGQESLVPISQKDETNLQMLGMFLQNRNNPALQSFDMGFLRKIFRQAHTLEHTQYVLFEKIGTVCQVRFQHVDNKKDSCVSFVDAVAICMVLTSQQPAKNVSHPSISIFAHRYLFSLEYWESLFVYHT